MTIKKYKNGETYGSLKIISEDEGRTRSGDRLAKCLCVCGSEVVTRVSYLGSGHTKTCGCLQGTKTKKHGMYDTKTYRAWMGMIQRCENKNHKFYHACGAIGISVCEKWRSSFDSFLSDVGAATEPDSILCRRDVKKNFEPGNVYWSSGLDRILNRRKWSGTSSKYKGVYWIKSRGKWRSEIKIGDKKHHLGYFLSERDAYHAFCEAHLEMRGVAVKHGERKED